MKVSQPRHCRYLRLGFELCYEILKVLESDWTPFVLGCCPECLSLDTVACVLWL